MCCLGNFMWVSKLLTCYELLQVFMISFLCILLTGMPKRSFKKKCFLMLVQEIIVKQRKLIILGEFAFAFVVSSDLVVEFHNLLLLLPDILLIGFYFVHLAGGLKMIGIIMATKGWTLLVLYLEACSEWFVLVLCGIIGIYSQYDEKFNFFWSSF